MRVNNTRRHEGDTRSENESQEGETTERTTSCAEQKSKSPNQRDVNAFVAYFALGQSMPFCLTYLSCNTYIIYIDIYHDTIYYMYTTHKYLIITQWFTLGQLDGACS